MDNRYLKIILKWSRKLLKVVLYLHLALVIIVGIVCFYLISHNPSYSSLMLYRSNYQFSKTEDPSFLFLQKVPKQFQRSLINLEDSQFYKHWGFDINAIKRAIKLNKEFGRTAYGGSTITQQLARTLFLTPHKTYLRKYLELIIAVEMELFLSKDRIFELYLNYVEWGDGIYGVQDASKHYYKKNLDRLKLDEQFRLLTILASPVKHTPYDFKGNRQLAKRLKFLYRYK